VKKVKIIIAAVVLLLVVIVVSQNTQPVETKLLFMQVTMPWALLLLITLLVGFAAGVIMTASLMTARRRKAPSQPQRRP
jgi:uncharacterized integral membrane protein